MLKEYGASFKKTMQFGLGLKLIAIELSFQVEY